jgi:hypothetical protein
MNSVKLTETPSSNSFISLPSIIINMSMADVGTCEVGRTIVSFKVHNDPKVN